MFCVALLGFLTRFAPAASADDAAALLAKHKAYVGWTLGTGITSLRMHGIDEKGRDYTVLRRGVVDRTVATAGGLDYLDTGFTGRILWTILNGFIVPIVGDGARYAITYSVLMNEAFADLAAKPRGSKTIDGTPTTGILVQPPNADALELWIDPATGKLARAVIDPDGASPSVLDDLDFTTLPDGKRVLSSWTTVSGTIKLTRIEENSPISDAELHPPKPAASWAFPSPSVTVPIDVEDTRITFSARINGVEGQFLFDTGANGMDFSDAFVRRAKLQPAGTAQIIGVTGKSSATRYHVDRLEVGGASLGPLDGYGGLYEGSEKMDGIIGFDLLASTVVDIDPKAKRMTLYDPSQATADSSKGYTIVADLTSGSPVIPVQLNGVPTHLVIDSGASQISLIQARLRGNGPNKVTMLESSQAFLSGVGGDSAKPEGCGFAQSMRIGPIVYDHVLFCFHALQMQTDGLLGFDFFKNFAWTFDYPDGKIVISPSQ